MEHSEYLVVKQIHKTLDCAEEEYEEDKDDDEHVKYMAKAYWMLQAYFLEKGVDPNQYTM